RQLCRTSGRLPRRRAVGREPVDGGDLGAVEAADRRDAGADRLAVDMHGAGAALRDPAAELAAGQSDLLAQHPEKRHLALDIEPMRGPVDLDRDHDAVPLRACSGTAGRRRARLPALGGLAWRLGPLYRPPRVPPELEQNGRRFLT